MGELYKTVIGLCEQRGITGYRLCKDIGISPNTMTELRKGRRNGVSAATMSNIASYFGVTVEYLLGTEKENPATANGDGLTDKEQAILECFRKLDPALQDFVLRSLESGIPLPSVPGAGEEGK